MGNGPINFDWNSRYFVLDTQSSCLSWSNSENDQKQKGYIMIKDALISDLSTVKG